MRRTQQQRRAQTRASLLEAAAQVFAQRGYAAATVAEIAQAAGCSTGALYAHFPSKADLFLALMDEAIPAWSASYAEQLDHFEGGLDDQLAAVTARWSHLLDDQPQLTMLFVEFWSVAMRDPELRPRFAERHAEIRASLANLLRQGLGHRDGPDVPVETLSAIVTALGEGLALQRLADPDAVPDDALLTALRVLLGAD